MFEATTDKESLFTGIEKNLLLYKKIKGCAGGENCEER